MRGRLALMLRRFLGACMALLAALVVAAGFLAWRLSEGPISLAYFAPRIEAALNERGWLAGSGARVTFDDALLAWEGWGEGLNVPLDVRLQGLRARDRDGNLLAELPEAAITLSMRALLLGEIVPQTVVLLRPSIRIRRAEDGSLDIGLAPARDGAAREDDSPAPGAADAAETLAAEPALAQRLLDALLRPAGQGTGPLSELRRVIVRDARLTVIDRQLHAIWRASRVTLDLRRIGGRLIGTGTLALRLGEEETIVAARAEVGGSPRRTEILLDLRGLDPQRLAAASPALADLGMLEGALSGSVRASLDQALAPLDAEFTLRAGPGRLTFPGAEPLMFVGAELHGHAAGAGLGTIAVERASLRFPPGPTAAGPVLNARLVLRRGAAEGGWHAVELSGGVDQVDLSNLGQWWPAGLRPNERAWLVANVTAGDAREGRFRIAGSMAPDFSELRPSEVSGRIAATRGTVHWLRPMPPVTNVAAEAEFFLDRIEVRTRGGELGRLRASGGLVVINKLEERTQLGHVEAHVTGPVAEAIALLDHPRLNLAARMGPEMRAATGDVDAALAFDLPLLNELPMDNLRLSVAARLANVRVPRIALGRDLDRGALDLALDAEGLIVTGQANVGGVAARLRYERDFRAGPPAQVLERYAVTGRADHRQLAGFGYDPAPFATGPVDLEIGVLTRRSGVGEVAVKADLTRAALAVEELGYLKPAGAAAQGELLLRLQNGRVTAGESMRVRGPDLDLRGRMAFAGPRLDRVEITGARVGASRFSGEVRQRGERDYAVMLRGEVADLTARFAHRRAEEAAATPSPVPTPQTEPPAGPRLAVDARFDRVITGEGRALTAVQATALHDGRVLRQLDLRARLGAQGTLAMTITPPAQGRARAITIQSDNAGELLRTLDIARQFIGGRLNLRGSFDDARPGRPLSGEAIIEEFRVGNAPALARLASAISLVGVLDLLAGPGVSFVRLTAPFTLTDEYLELRDARVWGPALGLTGRGRLDLVRRHASFDGTIVPAYLVNAILGNIPIIGQLFSPERGGGVFAASYRLRGPMDDPQTTVNPLSLLTPGFLRGIFDIGEEAAPPQAAPPQAAPPQATPPAAPPQATPPAAPPAAPR